ncbi:hypothetical protein scyTo_0027453, partial [Scyliorhinus torazame]|nr:hypothetical protein [Scyliorhinus torazame]
CDGESVLYDPMENAGMMTDPPPPRCSLYLTLSLSPSIRAEIYPAALKEEQRDYIFYLAVGNYRLKEYEKALKFIRTMLKNEPGNQQGLELEKLIDKKMQRGTR